MENVISTCHPMNGRADILVKDQCLVLAKLTILVRNSLNLNLLFLFLFSYDVASFRPMKSSQSSSSSLHSFWMELSLALTTTKPSSTSSLPLSHKLCEFHLRKKQRVVPFFDGARIPLRSVRASAERTGETITDRDARTAGFTSPAAMEVTTTAFNDADFPVWEKIGAVVRLSYGVGEIRLQAF